MFIAILVYVIKNSLQYGFRYVISTQFICMLVLPVDQNAGALSRQTWIDFCAASTSVFHRDSPREPAKEQNDAAAADHASTSKSATEPPITKSKTHEL